MAILYNNKIGFYMKYVNFMNGPNSSSGDKLLAQIYVSSLVGLK